MSTRRNIPQHTVTQPKVLSSGGYRYATLANGDVVVLGKAARQFLALDRSWWPASRSHASDGRTLKRVRRAVINAACRRIDRGGSV